MLLLAVEHATSATDKKVCVWGGQGVTERIQHEDDLERCLSHAERGQRGVPNTSVLEEGRHRQKTGLFYFLHKSFLCKCITNLKKKKKGNDSTAAICTHMQLQKSCNVSTQCMKNFPT